MPSISKLPLSYVNGRLSPLNIHEVTSGALQPIASLQILVHAPAIKHNSIIDVIYI